MPVSELRAENSYIWHDASGRSEPFIAFAEKAASQKGSDLPPLKSPKDFKIMGQNVARFDIPSKVDGTAVFGIDVDLPNMQYATVKAGSVDFRGDI